MEIQYAIVGVVIAIAIFFFFIFILMNGKKVEACSSCCIKNLCYKSNEEMECKSCSRVEKNDIK